jgi:hypothetical protein
VWHAFFEQRLQAFVDIIAFEQVMSDEELHRQLCLAVEGSTWFLPILTKGAHSSNR